MDNLASPYIEYKPGQLIAAQVMNDMQAKIRKDIHDQIAVAAEEIKHTGVERADNADKFDNKTPKNWTDELDQRYASKVHDHEGMSSYRRYIKEFTPEVDEVLLEHKLGRFPLVDVYELLPVTTKDGFTDCKLLFYYGHRDAEEYGLWVKVYRDRVPLGLPFEHALAEAGVEYEDDDTIEDVLNDLWAAFMKDPNDEIKHCTTPWVDECCGERRTVYDLKRADQWNDLYLAIKPRKCGKGTDATTCQVEVEQVNYNTLYISANGLTTANAVADLMILLRS